MLSHAEMNLSKDLKDLTNKFDYRSSCDFAYQQELINQNLDTLILFSDIEDYYKQYRR